MQKVSRCGILRTQRLCPETASAPIEPGWKHGSVVEANQIIGTKHLRKIAEVVIFESAGVAVHVQQPRAGAVRPRLLRDQFFRKMVVEVGDQPADIDYRKRRSG